MKILSPSKNVFQEFNRLYGAKVKKILNIAALFGVAVFLVVVLVVPAIASFSDTVEDRQIEFDQSTMRLDHQFVVLKSEIVRAKIDQLQKLQKQGTDRLSIEQ